MGNKLCKKKADGTLDHPKSPTPFDRIINRLHLRPNTWKSESHLNQKQATRSKSNNLKSEKLAQNQLLSKSSDWTDVALEVPSEKDQAIHLRNPKLALIFDNDSNTPTPPPRKHKKGFREKIEAVAKTGLQAFQSRKPVDEPIFVKKTVNPTCPLDDHDCAIHNRNHKHDLEASKEKKNLENEVKQSKRRKNLSVVSLPNFDELKLSAADNFENVDLDKDENSLASLPAEPKKLPTVASTGKLETYMTRCRSFGSLLPQQLLDRLKVKKTPIDIESDDSFGGLEDWDLRIIEHYNPKDASLPRQTNLSRVPKDVLSDVELLIVQDEDSEKPKAPARRSESLLKKINREASECANEQRLSQNNRATSPTPPPSPERKPSEEKHSILIGKLPTVEDGHVGHSSLLKILEDFSIKDKQQNKMELKENINSVEDFLEKEKLHTNIDMQPKLGNLEMVKT